MHLSIVAQYLTGLSVETYARPYQSKGGLSMGIEAHVQTEQLPEEDHWRVLLEIKVEGANAAREKCFVVKATREAIVVTDAPAEDRERVFVQGVLVYLFASLRSDIGLAMLPTGYGPVTLPPITVDQLQSLLHRHA